MTAFSTTTAPSHMGLFGLLRPKVQMARNFVAVQDWKSIVLFGLVTLVVMLCLYGVCHRLLFKIDGVAIIGPLLKRYLLSMVLFSFLLMLVFSNVIASLSTFYGSEELEILFASPVSYPRIFLAKFVETTFISSWMVFGSLLMLLVAYGQTYQSPWYFYLVCWLPIVPFCVFPAATGICISLGLARVLPVHQTRNMLRFLSAIAIGLLVLFFRMLRPEQLMRPEKFKSFTTFLYSLHNPRLELFPSAWTANTLLESMGLDLSTFGWDATRLFGGAALAFLFTYWMARRYHFVGWLKFQESGERGRKGGLTWLRGLDRLLGWMSIPGRAILEKDVKVFIRSPVLWTQFLLMMVIVAIYIYNVYLLPLAELAYVHPLLPDFLSFLNIGFVAFIIVACALRFGYPAVSMEGSVFYRIHASPISLTGYLWIKFWTNFLPLLTISLVLVTVSNLLLGVKPAIFALGLLDGVLVALVVSSLAIVFGAYYRNFKAENFAQIPSGFGGMVFMVACLAFVTVLLTLQSYPMYVYYTVWRQLGGGASGFELAGAAICMAASVAMCGFLWLRPMRWSAQILEYLEDAGG
jgi:ABC-2 type transport system permease protein